jgi:hypothetical protein
MSAAASMSNNSLVGYLSQIDTSKLSEDLYDKRILNDLNTHMKILELQIKNYDKLFNYTKYAINKLEMLSKQIEELSKSGVSTNNQRIKSLQENIYKTSSNYATTKNIFNSPNILPKKVTMETFISTLTNLSNAITDVYKDIFKLPADKLFKSSSLLGNSAETKKQKFLDELLRINTSVKEERGKFIKLKRTLEEAEAAQSAGETAAKLKARLNKLKGDFNSASSIPIAGLSNPQQRNKITKAIANIQRKINTTTKGGRVTRKHRYSRRRQTRRN